MQSDSNKNYRPGHWVVLGTALGAFIGLLISKFAIGLIFGFFVGLAIDATKRKSATAAGQGDAKDGDKS